MDVLIAFGHSCTPGRAGESTMGLSASHRRLRAEPKPVIWDEYGAVGLIALIAKLFSHRTISG
jgi:hypothetical protein